MYVCTMTQLLNHYHVGLTAIEMATKHSHPKLVKYLLKSGATADA